MTKHTRTDRQTQTYTHHFATNPLSSHEPVVVGRPHCTSDKCLWGFVCMCVWMHAHRWLQLLRICTFIIIHWRNCFKNPQKGEASLQCLYIALVYLLLKKTGTSTRCWRWRDTQMGIILTIWGKKQKQRNKGRQKPRTDDTRDENRTTLIKIGSGGVMRCQTSCCSKSVWWDTTAIKLADGLRWFYSEDAGRITK